MVGAKAAGEGRTTVGGWSMGVPASSKNKDWALDLLLYATNSRQMLRSMATGNMPPRNSVLNDQEILKKFGWAGASALALKTAVPQPGDNLWGSLDGRLRSGLSEAYLGQKTAQESLDAVAADWERTIKRSGLRP
jgi:multiple sugar transport system substrate-binding protein